MYPFLDITDIGVFADIGSDKYPILQNNIRIYRDRRQFSMTSFPRCNQYQIIPTSAFHDIGAIFPILGPPAPTSHRHWQQPPAGGRAGRRRATAQALQQAQPLDPRHAQTFCRPGGLPSIQVHRAAAAAQATAENSVKLEKFEKFNDINVPLS